MGILKTHIRLHCPVLSCNVRINFGVILQLFALRKKITLKLRLRFKFVIILVTRINSMSSGRSKGGERTCSPPPLEPLCISKHSICSAELIINKFVYQKND